MHVVKYQSVIIKYMQEAGEPENDAGFLKIIIAAVHVASLNYRYSYPSKPRVVVTVLGCTSNNLWFH